MPIPCPPYTTANRDLFQIGTLHSPMKCLLLFFTIAYFYKTCTLQSKDITEENAKTYWHLCVPITFVTTCSSLHLIADTILLCIFWWQIGFNKNTWRQKKMHCFLFLDAVMFPSQSVQLVRECQDHFKQRISIKHRKNKLIKMILKKKKLTDWKTDIKTYDWSNDWLTDRLTDLVWIAVIKNLNTTRKITWKAKTPQCQTLQYITTTFCHTTRSELALLLGTKMPKCEMPLQGQNNIFTCDLHIVLSIISIFCTKKSSWMIFGNFHVLFWVINLLLFKITELCYKQSLSPTPAVKQQKTIKNGCLKWRKVAHTFNLGNIDKKNRVK